MTHVLQRDIVDGKEAHRGAVLGSHVGDRRTIGDTHFIHAGAKELDKLSNHAFFTQNFDHSQNHVGCGCASRQCSGQFKADDFRHQHVQRLTQHVCFGFDSTNAPAEYTEAVDHGRVAVRSDERVGHRNGAIIGFFERDDAGKVLQVDLVNDSDVGWNDTEIVKRLLAPTKEFVAFFVAFEFHVDVLYQRAVAAEKVDLDTVVDHEVDGDQWIDFFGVAAETRHGRSHCCQIDHRRDAREVLKNNSIGLERDLLFCRRRRLPGSQVFYVLLTDQKVIAVA